jgi:hypothetical protein
MELRGDTDRSTPPVQLAAVFADCIYMRSQLGSVSFKYCPRDTNQMAHEIARDSFFNNSSRSWEVEAPRFIVTNLINDVT